MPRTFNPFANDAYPTDPAWGQIGNNLATALFGNPELAAQMQLRKAQMEEMAAQAERARAGAALDTEKTRGERGQNDTVFGNGPSSLSSVISDPALVAVARANPSGFNATQFNVGTAGSLVRSLLANRMPAAAPVTAVPQVGGLSGAVIGGPQIANPNQPVRVDDEGGIVVETRKTPPPVVRQPPLDEQTLRLISMLQGDMPTETTALTPEYGDLRQTRELGSQEKRTRMTADASMYGDRVRAGATVRSAQIGAGATMAGQRLTDSRERGLGTFGPGAGDTGGKPAPRFQPSQLGNMDAEIKAQMPRLPDDLQTKVRVRAVELAQRSGNPAAAVQQALSEIVEKDPGDSGAWWNPFDGRAPGFKEKPQAAVPTDIQEILNRNRR